jgi:hypothetical protein
LKLCPKRSLGDNSIFKSLGHSIFKVVSFHKIQRSLLRDQDVVKDNLLMLIAQEVMDQIKLGNIKLAHERCEQLGQEDKLGVWSLLNAKTKLALKKYLEA